MQHQPTEAHVQASDTRFRLYSLQFTRQYSLLPFRAFRTIANHRQAPKFYRVALYVATHAGAKTYMCRKY